MTLEKGYSDVIGGLDRRTEEGLLQGGPPISLKNLHNSTCKVRRRIHLHLREGTGCSGRYLDREGLEWRTGREYIDLKSEGPEGSQGICPVRRSRKRDRQGKRTLRQFRVVPTEIK